MKSKKQGQNVKHKVAPQVTEKQELHKYEESFKRWLSGEIHAGRMSIRQAIIDLKVNQDLVYRIVKQYPPAVPLTLPIMTEEEKKKLEKQQARIMELEKQLQDAQVKNIALETLIDVAEKDLKIDIRKKPGAKQ